jgi:serine/threonine protein kinase
LSTVDSNNIAMGSSETLSVAAQYELNLMESKSALKVRDEELKGVEWADIDEYACAGHGCFSNVFKVNIKTSGMEMQQYALKRLAFDLLKTPADMTSAASDLVSEGEILARISHENIIQLHAITSGGPSKAFKETEGGYFLILELLEDTLTDRLKNSRKRDKGFKSFFRSSSAFNKDFNEVVLGIAKGIKYLHEKNIVYRDLKPDNIGFDKQGKVKLFDLGLAREAHMIEKEEIAGSLRYMAPEVALGIGSVLASDVYSFGVLLWEIFTCDVPYNEYRTKQDFIANVIYQGRRPSLKPIRNAALRVLISQCWSEDPKDRPTFKQILILLERELSLPSNMTESEASLALDDESTSSWSISSSLSSSVKSKKYRSSFKKFSKSLKRANSEPTRKCRSDLGIKESCKPNPNKAARAA